MHGQIRIGRWMPFTAHQIVAPDGYLWAAEAGRFGIRVRGFDRYSGATGQMSWRLFGRIPVVSAAGPDITLSAGRPPGQRDHRAHPRRSAVAHRGVGGTR